MKNSVITATGLGKRYFIGHERRESYTALRDVLVNRARAVMDRISRVWSPGSAHVSGRVIEEFWALQGLDFEIARGDAVGIIGRNGAGKSTLLKVLSRITEPTRGQAEINGRLASLLEVGTGFHPELTGRENIFLNGAILGMSRSEIRARFDEIVEFSGVEKFLDTPVKRFSSGMYVRLAFSVAAHLSSEILIVDEVLAVGDADFQKKCLGKMGDATREQGRTVLFVSHNMLAIQQLCNRGMVLERGRLKFHGNVSDAVACYSKRESRDYSFQAIVIPDIELVVTSIQINAERSGIVHPHQEMVIDIEIECRRDVDRIGIELLISSPDVNGIVFATNTKTRKGLDVLLRKGRNRVTCRIDKLNLCSGRYSLGFGIDIPFVSFYFYERDLLDFVVEETVAPPCLLPTIPAYGRVYLDHEFHVESGG